MKTMPVPVGGYKLPSGRTSGGDSADTKKSGTYKGKSNALGHGGRAKQLKDKGVPDAVIGQIARSKQAAPGQKNYHGGKAGKK